MSICRFSKNTLHGQTRDELKRPGSTAVARALETKIKLAVLKRERLVSNLPFPKWLRTFGFLLTAISGSLTVKKFN